MVLFFQISSICILPIPLIDQRDYLQFTVIININLSTWFKRCPKESLFIYSFTHLFTQRIFVVEDTRGTVLSKLDKEPALQAYFFEFLIKRQPLLGRLSLCMGIGGPDSILFSLWKTLNILTKSPCSYIRVNQFYVCLLPPHFLPWRLLQEGLEKLWMIIFSSQSIKRKKKGICIQNSWFWEWNF